MASDRKLSVAYDRPVDVLHVVLGSPVPYEGDGRDGGLEFDYSMTDDSAVGAKVIGFRRNGWSKKVPDLSIEIAAFLKVDAKDLAGRIQSAVK